MEWIVFAAALVIVGFFIWRAVREKEGSSAPSDAVRPRKDVPWPNDPADKS